MSVYAKLFEGVEGLDEGFAERADTILTAHIHEAVEKQVNEAKVEHQAELDALAESHATEITSLKESAEAYGIHMASLAEAKSAEVIDQHMSTFLNEWATENAPAIDAQLKVELAESFLTGVGGLMLEHNVVIPEGRDVLAESEQHAAELEDALNESIQARADDRDAVDADARELAILRESVGLTATEVDRVRTLSEPFALDESFSGRVKTIRESLATGGDPAGDPLTNLNEGADLEVQDEQVHSDVDETLKFLRR